MDVTTLSIQAVCGAVGGNLGGLLTKAKSLGPVLNTFAGAIGGLLGGQVLGSLLAREFGHAMTWNVTTSALFGLGLPFVVGVLSRKTT